MTLPQWAGGEQAWGGVGAPLHVQVSFQVESQSVTYQLFKLFLHAGQKVEQLIGGDAACFLFSATELDLFLPLCLIVCLPSSSDVVIQMFMQPLSSDTDPPSPEKKKDKK